MRKLELTCDQEHVCKPAVRHWHAGVSDAVPVFALNRGAAAYDRNTRPVLPDEFRLEDSGMPRFIQLAARLRLERVVFRRNKLRDGEPAGG